MKHEKSCLGNDASNTAPMIQPSKASTQYHLTVQRRNIEQSTQSGDHLQLVNPPEPKRPWGQLFKCPHCDKVNKAASVMEKHIRSTHQGLRYRCCECEKRLKEQEALMHSDHLPPSSPTIIQCKEEPPSDHEWDDDTSKPATTIIPPIPKTRKNIKKLSKAAKPPKQAPTPAPSVFNTISLVDSFIHSNTTGQLHQLQMQSNGQQLQILHTEERKEIFIKIQSKQVPSSNLFAIRSNPLAIQPNPLAIQPKCNLLAIQPRPAPELGRNNQSSEDPMSLMIKAELSEGPALRKWSQTFDVRLNRKYRRRTSLEPAILKKSNGKVKPANIKCDKCGLLFRERTNFKHHYRSEHEGIRYTCPACPLQWRSKYAFFRHPCFKKDQSLQFQIIQLELNDGGSCSPPSLIDQSDDHSTIDDLSSAGLIKNETIDDWQEEEQIEELEIWQS